MMADELRKKTCCFTGHRDIPIDRTREVEERTANEVRSLIRSYGVCFFGVGGAIGYDTLAAKVLFRLKEKEFPNIKVILVYPFDGFTSRWTPKEKATYVQLLPQYDKVVCVSAQAGKEAYFARNRHLVDGSAYCITYCTDHCSGTAYTIRYARQRGLEIRNIGSNA